MELAMCLFKMAVFEVDAWAIKAEARQACPLQKRNKATTVWTYTTQPSPVGLVMEGRGTLSVERQRQRGPETWSSHTHLTSEHGLAGFMDFSP